MNRFERRHPDASNEWPVFNLSEYEFVSLWPLDLAQRVVGNALVHNVKAVDGTA